MYCVSPGIVTSVHRHTTTPTFGTHVHIFHSDLGVWSHYAHLQSTSVAEGQTIPEGQQIGTLGKSGTTVAHLHFAIKKQPTGIDAVAKTKGDLAKWENPTTFIEAHLSPILPMPDTISIDKITFEKLVKNSTIYDSLVAKGVSTASDVDTLTQAITQAQQERQTALDEAKKVRADFDTFKSQIADKLQSTQDLPRIISTIDDIMKKNETLEKQASLGASENEIYEAQLIEFKAEITRLQTLINSNNPLSSATALELVQELLSRFAAILKRK